MFQDSNNDEHFFNGSIANVDLERERYAVDYIHVNEYLIHRYPPELSGSGWFSNSDWEGALLRLARPLSHSETSKSHASKIVLLPNGHTS